MSNYTFTVENQGKYTYLVYAFQEFDEIDTLSLGMITNNKIKGLAKTVFTQMDTSKYLKYDISAKVSVNKLFTEKISKKKLMAVLSNIIDTITVTEEYMIDEKMILLDLDYIFMDLVTYDTQLIVLPVTNVNRKYKELRMFIKDIMVNGQFDFTENLDYVAKIINFLNSNSDFSISSFKKLLDEIQMGEVKAKNDIPKKVEKTPEIKVKREESGKQDICKETVEDISDEKQISLFYLLQHYNKENAALYKVQRERKKNGAKQGKERTREEDLDILFGSKKNNNNNVKDIGFAIPGQEKKFVGNIEILKSNVNSSNPYADFCVEKEIVSSGVIDIPRGEDMDFGDTVYLDDETTEMTTLLDDEEKNVVIPYLISKESGEKILINKPLFRIGRKKDYADYCIRKSTISEKHAYIVEREDGFYIVDTKSKNHTYLDGTKIQDNTEIKLAHGMEIFFAKEGFEFRMF